MNSSSSDTNEGESSEDSSQSADASTPTANATSTEKLTPTTSDAEFSNRLAMAEIQLNANKVSEAEATVEPLKTDFGHPEYPKLVAFLEKLEAAKAKNGVAAKSAPAPAGQPTAEAAPGATGMQPPAGVPNGAMPTKPQPPAGTPLAESNGNPTGVVPPTGAGAANGRGSSPNPLMPNPEQLGSQSASRSTRNVEPASMSAELVWLYDDLVEAGDSVVTKAEASTTDVRRAIDRTKQLADAGEALKLVKSYMARHTVSSTDLRRLENQVERLSEKAEEGLFRNGAKWQTLDEYKVAKHTSASRLKSAAAACGRGDFKTALVELEAASKADFLDPTGPFVAGLILASVDMNAIESAQKSFEMVLERSPNDIDAMHNRAIVMMRQGEVDISQRLFDYVAEASPSHPQLAANVARAAALGDKQLLPISRGQVTALKGLLSRLKKPEHMPSLPTPKGWLFAPATISKTFNLAPESNEIPFQTWKQPANAGIGIAIDNHHLLCLKPAIYDDANLPCVVATIGAEPSRAGSNQQAEVIAVAGDEQMALLKSQQALPLALPLRPEFDQSETYFVFKDGEKMNVAIDEDRSSDKFPLHLAESAVVGSPVLDQVGRLAGLVVPEFDDDTKAFDPSATSTRLVPAEHLVAFIQAILPDFAAVDMPTPPTPPNAAPPSSDTAPDSVVPTSPPPGGGANPQQAILPVIAYSLKTNFGVSIPRSVTNPLEDCSCPRCWGMGKVDCPNCGNGQVTEKRSVRDFYNKIKGEWHYSIKKFPVDCPQCPDSSSCPAGSLLCPVCRGSRYATGR